MAGGGGLSSPRGVGGDALTGILVRMTSFVLLAGTTEAPDRTGLLSGETGRLSEKQERHQDVVRVSYTRGKKRETGETVFSYF